MFVVTFDSLIQKIKDLVKFLRDGEQGTILLSLMTYTLLKARLSACSFQLGDLMLDYLQSCFVNAIPEPKLKQYR